MQFVWICAVRVYLWLRSAGVSPPLSAQRESRIAGVSPALSAQRESRSAGVLAPIERAARLSDRLLSVSRSQDLFHYPSELLVKYSWHRHDYDLYHRLVSLFEDRHQGLLRQAGWRSRGYLPHFDGRATPQFITLHLADSVPKEVVERWKAELSRLVLEERTEVFQRRIENYLDQGFGQRYLGNPSVAEMVQESLLKFSNSRYRLFSWVIMPNHFHCLMKRFEEFELSAILHSFKSYTAHEANKILNRNGEFWWEEYFDRYIRNADHFQRAVRYIENNPVKAKLCKRPEDWPYGSAWYRHRFKEW